ncbi:hypothetical protein KWH45_21005 [Xanthomonas campestris pv. mirabilis]|uniref:hypothetical protein n=1 Tax=Xanthomonas euvesicatoria TaxID=456327 RepID=UPI001C45FA7B|nr:hypothetical protein [Xanthomonas euvesicatoria]MBV6855893.1 hypothetical protein [Xanthomonas campestris pv. mirabilis]
MTANCHVTLAEGFAINARGHVTARHPAGYSLDGLLMLQRAARKFASYLPANVPTSFADWADRIEACSLARIETDYQEVARTLRDMHSAAQPVEPPASMATWISKLKTKAPSSTSPALTDAPH